MSEASLPNVPPEDDDSLELDSLKSGKCQIVMISSAAGVREMINELQECGFADADAWSQLIAGPDSGEAMGILTQQRPQEP